MKKELIAHRDPKSPVSEVFRTLRTNIQFMNSNNSMQTLLVTSTFPGEGKSWVTSNLAVTFAQAGKSVILLDADMRKGRQYNIFGVLPKPGLSNYLSNTDDNDISHYIQETDVENLYVVSAGNVPPNPSELLVSDRMMKLMDKLKDACDLLIIDGTPCDLVTDSIILSRIVDSTIIVTAHKETKKDNLEKIVKNIQNVGGKIAGIVLNKVPIPAKKYNQSYYYGSIPSDNKNSKKKDINRRYQQIRDMDYKEDKDYTEHKNDDEYNSNDDIPNKIQKDEDNEEYNNLKNMKIEKDSSIPEEKANDILKQINEYLESEKKKLKQGE